MIACAECDRLLDLLKHEEPDRDILAATRAHLAECPVAQAQLAAAAEQVQLWHGAHPEPDPDPLQVSEPILILEGAEP